MLKKLLALPAAIALSSCSSTPADLEAKTKAETVSYAENYQEIYRRVFSVASRCGTGNISAYASFDLDAQLYSELGYGELTMSLSNLGTRNYFWKAKIERNGEGSKMTVNSGNSLAAPKMQRDVFRWAKGDEKC